MQSLHNIHAVFFSSTKCIFYDIDYTSNRCKFAFVVRSTWNMATLSYPQKATISSVGFGTDWTTADCCLQ
ncbi:hypothetical protein L3X38_040747 [Prunus dulcis]|uniref:Uncharacterized protein n=1 Tax=Prunus dulcis TaxID=3755 RepID=A0AAD4YJZ7_PRUDU|nr:hypothetical protein L3X38_040747 [Prunus dulcis]